MYSKEQIDKIGNTIVFLASNIEHASKTKILKLLYILDEFAIRQTGIPFLNLEYRIWKFGPVVQDIYIDLTSDLSLLKDYIVKQNNEHGHCYIHPKNSFCDDEFSDKDIEILGLVVDEFKDYTPTQLIEYTHRESSLWYKIAKENGVLDQLLEEKLNCTDIKIDMSELIKYDSTKLSIYNSIKEFC